jgi:hypothetical protein
MPLSVTATALFVGLIAGATATIPAASPPLVVAHAMVQPARNDNKRRSHPTCR